MDQCGCAGVCSCSTACTATRNSTGYTRDVAAHRRLQKQLRRQPGLQERGVEERTDFHLQAGVSFLCRLRPPNCPGIEFQMSLTAGSVPSGCYAMSLPACLLLIPPLQNTNTTSRHPLDRRAAVVPPTRSSLWILSKEGLKFTAPSHLSHVPTTHILTHHLCHHRWPEWGQVPDGHLTVGAQQQPQSSLPAGAILQENSSPSSLWTRKGSQQQHLARNSHQKATYSRGK